jgi:hypothetical protein
MSGLLYRNIHLYRFGMSLLYGGGYRERFKRVCAHIPANTGSVTELCFGDIHVAEWCVQRHIEWTGVEFSEVFCNYARTREHRVICGDVCKVDLPDADLFIVMGSLYHFHGHLDRLFDRIFEKSKRLLISEPVVNLSNRNALLRTLGALVADPGVGSADFRFDRSALLGALDGQARRLGLSVTLLEEGRDLIATVD